MLDSRVQACQPIQSKNIETELSDGCGPNESLTSHTNGRKIDDFESETASILAGCHQFPSLTLCIAIDLETYPEIVSITVKP